MAVWGIAPPARARIELKPGRPFFAEAIILVTLVPSITYPRLRHFKFHRCVVVVNTSFFRFSYLKPIWERTPLEKQSVSWNSPSYLWVKVQRALLLLIGFVISVAAVGCTSPDPPEWKIAIATASPTPANKTLPTSNQIVVYLDTSASMAGYVSQNQEEQTAFSHTLQELRNLATILNPPLDVFVRHVDTSVGPLLNDTDLTVASISPGVYTGRETDLAGAIDLFPAPLLREENHQNREGDSEQPTPAPPPRFQVLVTDGVQSTRDQRPGGACVTGSDQVCVRKKILDLINRGWGGCVLGIKSEFNGRIYSEISHAVIPYRTRKHDANTHRPFYLYIFSPDREALAQVVKVLRDRLRPLVAQEEGLRELSLTLPYAKGQAQAVAVVPKDQQDTLNLSRTVQQDPARLTMRLDLSAEKTGPRRFTMTIGLPWSDDALYMGPPKERAELVRWELVPVYPKENASSSVKENPARLRLPELALLDQQVDDGGHPILQFSASWPKGTGAVGWRVYHLRGQLNLEKQTPAWVQQWSTNLDTTQETGNRTLYLESVLLGVWRNDVVKNLIVGEAYIRLGPQ